MNANFRYAVGMNAAAGMEKNVPSLEEIKAEHEQIRQEAKKATQRWQHLQLLLSRDFYMHARSVAALERSKTLLDRLKSGERAE